MLHLHTTGSSFVQAGVHGLFTALYDAEHCGLAGPSRTSISDHPPLVHLLDLLLVRNLAGHHSSALLSDCSCPAPCSCAQKGLHTCSVFLNLGQAAVTLGCCQLLELNSVCGTLGDAHDGRKWSFIRLWTAESSRWEQGWRGRSFLRPRLRISWCIDYSRRVAAG